MNYAQLALSKNLVYELKRQYNNKPKYQVIDTVTCYNNGIKTKKGIQ